MARGPWRVPLRAAAITCGLLLPLVSAGIAAASLPSPPPLPPNPDPTLPVGGNGVTLVIAPPSVVMVSSPPQPGDCDMYVNYDNSSVRPMTIVFRGQTACGDGVNSPTMDGQVTLKDTFGNVVASGNWFGPITGRGPDTSKGDYTRTGALGTVSANDTGPVPGESYTMTLVSDITLVAPQYWTGPLGFGCTVSGETEHCVTNTGFVYLPGTRGGITPD